MFQVCTSSRPERWIDLVKLPHVVPKAYLLWSQSLGTLLPTPLSLLLTETLEKKLQMTFGLQAQAFARNPACKQEY